MFGRPRFLTTALAAALIGAVGAGPALAQQQAFTVAAPASKKAKRGLFNNVPLPVYGDYYGRKGAGISMAQQKRACLKKKNKARNLAAHR